MLLAAAVPVRVIVLSLVMPSPFTPLSLEKDEMTGASGLVEVGGVVGLEIVTGTADEALPVLPAASIALAVMLWLPVARLLAVKVQLPALPAVAVPIWVVPS